MKTTNVMIDTETGGLVPGFHGVTQIAVIAFDIERKKSGIFLTEKDRWQTKVQPRASDYGLHYDTKALEMQGETMASLTQGGIAPDNAIGTMNAFIKQYLDPLDYRGKIWAHEAIFDWAMIRKSLVEKVYFSGNWKNIEFTAERCDWSCSKFLFRSLMGLGMVQSDQKDNLRYIAEHYGIEFPESEQHRALKDTQVSIRCLEAILNDHAAYYGAK